MNEYYVVLSGAKNNSGDYYIGHRARQLFRALRPDREIVEYPAWLPLDSEKLAIINRSQALLLVGGPALRPDIWPGVYPLTPDLSNIKVPIVTLGVGYKGATGDWNETRHSGFTPASLTLLSRINKNATPSSVRDFHTLNVLQSQGFHNFVMTGCPGLYSFPHLGSQLLHAPKPILGISPGTTFASNASAKSQLIKVVRTLAEKYGTENCRIAFHHTIDTQKYIKAYGNLSAFLSAQQELAKLFTSAGLEVVDVSGESEAMLAFYQSVDIHVGYRVHAHLLMCSISKPSILIAEDGRGGASRGVLGGLVFDAWLNNHQEPLQACPEVAEEICRHLEYETVHGFPRLSNPRRTIDALFPTMANFFQGLP